MTDQNRIPDDENEYAEWEWSQLAHKMAGEITTEDPFHDGSLRMLLEHAEEVLVTACLSGHSHASKIIGKILPQDFLPGQQNWRREIYKAVLTIHESGEEINVLTVGAELASKPVLIQRLKHLPFLVFAKTKPDIGIYVKAVRERARKKKLWELGQKTTDASKNGHTSKEITENIIQELQKITAGDVSPDSADVDDMVREHDEFVDLVLSGEIRPLDLPYIGLEEVVLYPGNQVVIGAHTSVGKSAFALNIAIDYARCGLNVLWVTTEMTKIEMIQRITSCLAGIGVGLLRKHNVKLNTHPDVIQWKNTMKSNGGKFRIYYASICTEREIQSELDAMNEFGGCDVLFIDYIQDLESVEKFREERLKIAHLARWLRKQASERGLVLFTLSQMSRPDRETRHTRRKPTVWDLKETGAIENKTEVVILLHREDNTPGIREWNINVEVAKNRNGNRCEFNYVFDSWNAQWR